MPPLPLPGDTVGLADEAISAGNQAALLQALGTINAVVGVVANWLQVIMVVVDLITGELQADVNNIMHALNDIDQKVTDIVQVVQPGQTDIKMTSIIPILQKAIDDLNTLLSEPPPNYGPDVNESNFFSDAQLAAYIYAPDQFAPSQAYWTRPYLPDAVYLGQSGPQGTILDEYLPGDGLPKTSSFGKGPWVYDPQLAMPAFAFAISIFTTMTSIFHEHDLEFLRPWCTDLATFLHSNYQTAVQGLVMVPVPSLDLLKNMYLSAPYYLSWPAAQDGESLPITFTGDPQPIPYPEYWHGEIGAIDIYSTFGEFGWPSALQPEDAYGYQRLGQVANAGNIIGIYPALVTLMTQMELPVGWLEEYPRAYPNCYPWFHLRVHMGNVARWKALYIAKGYDKIWTLIQKLRAMSAGQPGTPEYGTHPTPSPETVDNNAHWRLTEILAICEELPVVPWWVDPPLVFDTPPPPPQYGPQPSISRMSAGQVINILLGALDNSVSNPTTDWDSLPGTDVPRPLSLRKTIASVAI